MNITFLIGNGFDVNLGIKSSYGDFYNWYTKTPSTTMHIAEFKNDIAKEIGENLPLEEQTWADLELGLGKYTGKFSKEKVENFLDCLEDAQQSIRDYLQEQEGKFKVDQYSPRALKRFWEGLLGFVEDVSDAEQIALKGLLDAVPTENRYISFVTFNYTHTLEKILGESYKEPLLSWQHGTNTYAYKLDPKIIHVHGTIEDHPVLGIDNKEQVANQELLETPQFEEMLIKAKSIEALGKLWHRQGEQQIAKSRLICVYGMSLGESDAKWWRQLAQWLKANTSRHLIIYWYEKNVPERVSSRWQINKVSEIKDRFLSYSNLTKNELSAIKSRIHIVINEKNRFDLTKAVLEEIATEMALATV